jgi:serine O-acetyltransferase
MSTSICIATHERAELLDETLGSIARQRVPAAEVVVSDSSSSPAAREVVARFAAAHPALRVRALASPRKALPWQRWWAASHAIGDWVLFLDDDVRLAPHAVETFERVRDAVARRGPVSGIGFVFSWEGGGEQPRRDTTSVKERWLGTAAWPPGALTDGGQTVSFFGLPPGETVEVGALWGGAMAFRRDVLRELSCLDNLVALYEAGVGRGEDGVLSHCASRHGRLYLINEPLAFHPRERRGPAPYARAGWKLGLTATWGRAHTMRWLAADPRACRREWRRLALLELGRAAAAAARRPWRASPWMQIAGVIAGSARALARWDTVPPEARSRKPDAGAAQGRKMRERESSSEPGGEVPFLRSSADGESGLGACVSAWKCFLEDVDRYRLRPRSRIAVILLSQGLWASAVYRFFYPLVRARSGWVRRISHFASVFAVKAVEILGGISLPPEAEVEGGLYVGHFGHVLVNARARIGRNCNLSPGVIIGSGGRGDAEGRPREGVPVLGNRVYVGPGAVLFGPIEIADDAAIGANAVVTKSVPKRAVVAGAPARVTGNRGSFLYVQYLGMEDDPDRLQSLRERDAERREAR